MELHGKAGITWNHTTGSDGGFVTDNRLNFNFTGSTTTPWSPSSDITTVVGLIHQILQITQEVEHH